MHMLMMTALGLGLLAVLAAIVQFVNRRTQSRSLSLIWAFIPIWAVVCLWNGYNGVVNAGYSVQAELAVHVVVFGLPALAAWFGRRI